ncbi:MAG: SCO family protein [Thermoanaerobaculia bacterium]|nr:SCO family protein [Thermoanaerobaculia bacterium]
MKRPLGVRSLFGAAVLLTVLACRGGGSGTEAGELAVMPFGGDFELTSVLGPVNLGTLRGHPAWLFFGYTTCPDICPTTLARLARARTLLVERGCDEEIGTLFVSVDPERDTPEKIAAYLDYFGLGALGATGTSEQLAAVGKAYGVAWERVEGTTPSSYLVNHSTYVFLLDSLGRVRHAVGHGDSPERIAELTAQLVESETCR